MTEEEEELEDAYHEAVVVLTQEQVDAIWAYVRATIAKRVEHSPFYPAKIAEMIADGRY